MKKGNKVLSPRDIIPDKQEPDSNRSTDSAPSWRIWQALWVLPLAIFIASLTGLVNNEGVSKVGVNLVAILLQDSCLLLLPLAIVCQYYKQTPEVLGFRLIKLGRILRIGILAGICLYLINVTFSVLINIVFPGKIEASQNNIQLLSLAENSFESIMLVLFFCILAPMAEETYFRAFVYPPLKFRFGRVNALILSAALFAFVHFNPWIFLPLFAGGLGFAWLYDRYSNIWINICAHMIWNFVVVALYFIFY